METLYWLIDEQTFGGMVVLIVFCSVLVLYVLMLRWIAAGAKETGD